MSPEPALLPDRDFLKQSPKKKTKPAIRVKLCTLCNEAEPLGDITCHGGEKTAEPAAWGRTGISHGSTWLFY